MIAVFLVFVGLAGPASASTSKLFQMGGNTYSVTRTASSGFKRDVDVLQAEAEADAAKYCADQGKQLKVITVSTDLPHFGLGYASAKIIFKALDAGSPELTSNAATGPAPDSANAMGSATTPVAQVILQGAPGDLYTELLKLDDLRKRGLLTDKEFDAEKKKLLKHSH